MTGGNIVAEKRIPSRAPALLIRPLTPFVVPGCSKVLGRAADSHRRRPGPHREC